MLMYISTYPSTVIMRTTSVTPIYAQTAIPGTGLHFQLHAYQHHEGLLFHTKRLILIDILWVMVPFFIICCIEADNITNDPNFTHFKVKSLYLLTIKPLSGNLGSRFCLC